MFYELDQRIQCLISTDGHGVRFSCLDETIMREFAINFATRQGMRDLGGIRVTYCDISAQPGNFEPDLGVPSAHFMVLVQHIDLEFAGTREPKTFTVFRTMKTRIGTSADPADAQFYEYHLNAALA